MENGLLACAEVLLGILSVVAGDALALRVGGTTSCVYSKVMGIRAKPEPRFNLLLCQSASE